MNSFPKTKLFLVLLVGALLGWMANTFRSSHPGNHPSAATSNEGTRRIAFYQSAMHPWIKSPTPGRCTLCGMELVPVYEGEAGFATDPGLITLGSNAVTAAGIRTATVARGALKRSMRMAGVIDDDDSRHRILSAYVDGRVDQLQVHYTGAEVTEGQPLATFYSPTLLTAVREYIALQSQPPASLAHRAASQRLRQLGLTDAQIAALPTSFAETNLHIEVLAPMAGTVVKRLVYAGQYVREGEPLFEIADFNTMWLKLDAYEQDLAWISTGQQVEVTTPALPGRTFNAPIRFIDPNLDPATRSAKVRVELPNPLSGGPGENRRAFLHRTYAEARVNVSVPDVLLIPRAAVLNPDGKPWVFVERNPGAYERVPIVLGRAGDVAWEVLGGVAEGDPVVTQGNLLLDSQAQLAQTAGELAPMHAPVEALRSPAASTPSPATTTEGPLAAFLKSVDAVRAALAADDLPGYATASKALKASLQTFASTVDHAHWHETLQQWERTLPAADARDLTAARQSFHAFNTVLLPALARLKDSEPVVKQLKMYECPMTDAAFPGAPKNARWFQFKGPLENPWFGKSMLTCGKEIRQ